MRQIINKFLSAGFIACMLVGSIFFTACEQEEVLNPTLKVFGPSPALRGGQLEFIGTNLDQVTSVILPDNIEVTDITVVTTGKIVVTIPQETKPGYVTLKTPKGDLKTITKLSFSEPISVESISPVSVKAGNKLTITGDYLYLIKEVIFNDGIVVESKDFISQSRKKIEVTVPLAAQTGKVIISNGEEIPILVYIDQPITVTLPAITGLNPVPVRPGGNLTITGTDLYLVKSLVFAGNKKVDAFTFNEDKTAITATLPDDVQEGTLKLVTYSGLEVESGVVLKLVAPEITAISPNPVKNGKNLTITGTNLDLATSVVFGGEKTGTIASQSSTSIMVEVPMEATEGIVTLNTKSGKTAESANLKFVKPKINTVSPLALMAGNNITITGTDLDLVRSVKFPGDQVYEVPEPYTNETSLVVTVPPAAISGAFTLVTVNGDEITSEASLSVEAANKPVITAITSPVKPGELLTITGSKLNLVESVLFQNGVKATSFGARTATSLEVYVPQAVKMGKVTLTLVSYAGDQVVSPEFTISGVDPITAATKMIMDFRTRSESDWHAPDWDNWGGSYDAATSKANGYITLVSSPGWWIIGCNHPDPNGGWPSVSTSDYVFKFDYKTEKPITINGTYDLLFLLGGEQLSYQFEPTNGAIQSPGNEWTTVTIAINGKLTNPTINSGNFGIIMNSNNGNDFAGLSFDNLRYDPK